MFLSLDSALAEVERLVSELDFSALSAEHSVELLERFCKAERVCAAGKALASARVAESNAWYDYPDRSPSHLLARTSRSTLAHSCQLLSAAETMRELPGVEQAFRRGELTERQAIEVSTAVALDPEAEQLLLEAAELESLKEFERQCARVRAAATPEEEKHHRAHKRRTLSTWTDLEGAFHLNFLSTPQAGAVVMAALEPFRQRAAGAAAGKGLKESEGAHWADGLVEMARRSGCSNQEGFRSQPSALVHVRVDHTALMRGYTVAGETCEAVGVGPIPVAAAREFAADSIMSALLTNGKDVLAVAHMGRSIPAHLKTALAERDQVCVVPGCGQTAGLEYDHTLEFAKGGPTSMDNLARLCEHHHSLKTYHGYRLKKFKGRWFFYPSDGPPPDLDAAQPELMDSGSTTPSPVEPVRLTVGKGGTWTPPPDRKQLWEKPKPKVKAKAKSRNRNFDPRRFEKPEIIASPWPVYEADAPGPTPV